ncbi:hydrolase [Leptolyngbya sp. 7M]|uniref:hydrolase n=1 Tax=Leptolyngbya sp. 7M TaxID=2812896 RepID=UPI001B8D4D29|nr:hydrolase [Leptolyngbya sp. 7M]QYO65347.1 hydrolase [Leptolyngbya sp. 7M]
MLEIDRCSLVVVDVQEAFRSAIPEFASIVSRISIAIRGFTLLGLPMIVTEQYPEGLGRTIEELQLALPDKYHLIEKSTFSAWGEQRFRSVLSSLARKQVVVCGIETHVCIVQTVQDLLAEGFEVHLLTDCVASRYRHDRKAGIQRMVEKGITSSSMEMALFELMGDSRHPRFKDVQALIK